MSESTRRIRALVKDEGLTCTQLGDMLGVTRAAASGKMRGVIGWGVKDIITLSEHFHVSTDYLLGRSDRERVNA